jgi:hypothetical protein
VIGHVWKEFRLLSFSVILCSRCRSHNRFDSQGSNSKVASFRLNLHRESVDHDFPSEHVQTRNSSSTLAGQRAGSLLP